MIFSCEQLSGFSEVEFLLLEETSNWPVVLNDQTSAQLIFNPASNNVEGLIQPESISIDSKPRMTSDGEQWDNAITFKFITRSEALEQLLEQYANRPGIVRAKLMTGFQKIYGSNAEPLYLSWSNDDGVKPEDNSGIVVNIGGLTSQRPVFYTV